jgi:O-6-methylguanine DNA methyltransferase
LKRTPATQRVILKIATPDGDFTAGYSTRGLAALAFPKSVRDGKPRFYPRPKIKADVEAGPPQAGLRRWHHTATVALKRALAGRAPRLLPPLDLSGGTEFQRQVWAALRKIGRGRTRSYGEIARLIGKPRAVRAVGSACGANPIPVFVPCHRVLAANQKLGGFSSGLNWKRTLLAREGVALERNRQSFLIAKPERFML